MSTACRRKRRRELDGDDVQSEPGFCARTGTATAVLSSILVRFPYEIVDILVSLAWEWHVFVEASGPRFSDVRQLYLERTASDDLERLFCASIYPNMCLVRPAHGSTYLNETRTFKMSGARLDFIDASRKHIYSSTFATRTRKMILYRDETGSETTAAPHTPTFQEIPADFAAGHSSPIRFEGYDAWTQRLYFWSRFKGTMARPWKWRIGCVDVGENTTTYFDTDLKTDVVTQRLIGERIRFFVRDERHNCFWSVFHSRTIEIMHPLPWRQNILRLDWSESKSMFGVSVFPDAWPASSLGLVQSFCVLPYRTKSLAESPSFCAVMTKLGGHDKSDDSYLATFSINHVTLDVPQGRSIWDSRLNQTILVAKRERSDAGAISRIVPSTVDPDTAYVLVSGVDDDDKASCVFRCTMGLGERKTST